MQRRPINSTSDAGSPHDADFIAAGRAKLFENLYTHEQISTIFQFSDRAMYDYTARGMPFIKVGARRYFDIEAVRAWLLSHQTDRSARSRGRPTKTAIARRRAMASAS